jgi:N-dimethylarginine dimethylaminohydrolase
MDEGAWRQAPVPQDTIQEEWNRLHSQLSTLGAVHAMAGVDGLPDIVFTANAAVVKGGRALLANFKCKERKPEHLHYKQVFEELNFDTVTLPEDIMHEGAGDAIWDAHRKMFWVGYGQRSDFEAAEYIEDAFDEAAISLELVSPRFYHLDTCFNILSGGHVIYFPKALSAESIARIKKYVPEAMRHAISYEDAYQFSANAVSVDGKVFMSRCSVDLRETLEGWGYEVRELNLSAFHKSGGSAFCLTLRLDW